MSRRRWWLLAGGLAVVVWLAVVAVLLVGAAADLREGRRLATAARDALDPATLASGEMVDDLRAADERFRSAHAATGNPLLAPVRVLPVVGRQLRSVHALSGAAAHVSAAAGDAAEEVAAVLADPSGGGPARLAQVRDLAGIVSRVGDRIDEVDLGPRDALLGPLADARDELAEELADARRAVADAEAGARAAVTLLEGPRRYLLVAANNAEMRAGSGMWLSGGVLTTAAGRLRLDEVRPLYEMADPPDGVPVGDAHLAARWTEVWNPSGDWRALMVSPRLPASASLALDMWEAAGREPVDGVMVVDPVGLAAVVRATGPARFADRSVSADELVELLVHDQYLTFDTDDYDQSDRRQALGDVARQAFDALDAGEWEPAVLASELADAVRGRHLMAWSRHAAEQAGWEAAGMDGRLSPDSLFLSVLNRGANKLDWFLHVDADLRTRPSGDGTDVTVDLRFRNTTPPGLPRYVAGPYPGFDWAPGTYVGLVSLNVPGAATGLVVEDVERTFGDGPDGPTLVTAFELVLEAGQELRRTVRFHLPSSVDHLVVGPSARVPAVSWRHGSSEWQDFAPRAVNW